MRVLKHSHLALVRLVRGGVVIMYAVIETGGKQYRVQEGDIVRVEKLDVQEGEKVDLSKVLLISNEDGIVVGKPYIDGAKVEATVIEHGKDRKIVIFKYKPKKDYRKKQGHRQPYTKIKIEKIVG
jgi:large subunit ribosomal protein L21